MPVVARGNAARCAVTCFGGVTADACAAVTRPDDDARGTTKDPYAIPNDMIT